MSVPHPEQADKAQQLAALANDLEGFVRQAAAEEQSLYAVEKATLARVLQIGHQAVELFLKLQGDGDLGPSVQTSQGKALERSPTPKARPLRTIFGAHAFASYVYSAGPKTKIELRPLEARMSLGEGKDSYLFEDFSQHFCVDQAFAAAQANLKVVLGHSAPVDSLERINHRLGEQAEPFLEQLSPPAAQEEGEILVLTADGKGVPILGREAQPQAAGDEASAPQRDGGKRMATLASVYSVARHQRTAEEVVEALFRKRRSRRVCKPPRSQPKHKRITARFGSVCDEGTANEMTITGTQNAIDWAAREAQQRLGDDQPLVVVCDGQASLWKAIGAYLLVWLGAQAHRAVEVLDIIHVAGYLWKAARAFYPKRSAAARTFVRARLLRILRGEGAGVIRGLRKMSTEHGLKGKAAKAVRTTCGYFEKNLDRMRYDVYLEAGYPIASGVIEGACRHVVKDRLERSGMRWTLAGAQAMLFVRSIYASHLTEEFHQARRDQEQKRLHPHRELALNVHPSLTLAV
jgi:hypothetical protein